jgi:hypothetical protein
MPTLIGPLVEASGEAEPSVGVDVLAVEELGCLLQRAAHLLAEAVDQLAGFGAGLPPLVLARTLDCQRRIRSSGQLTTTIRFARERCATPSPRARAPARPGVARAVLSPIDRT